MRTILSNWNNYPKREVELVAWSNEIPELINSAPIARGLGRCYGDASLGDTVISTLKHNKILSFDDKEGILSCESGVTLNEILEIFVPRGWFLPVTPGTKYITVGGALASDIHGKNHHAEGCFGDHVLSFNILLSDGQQITCTEKDNPTLFNATRGGMGLTGLISSVIFKLKKIETSFINQRQIKAKNLEEIIALFEQHKSYTYSMAWIDCLKGGKSFGRSIMMVGEHASPSDLSPEQARQPLSNGSSKKVEMPFNLPGFVLNTFSIKAFNWLYYHKNLQKDVKNTVHYSGFFYPLDAILHWNRMYGKKGFIQYQFVLPITECERGLPVILKKISEKGWGSFLAVLKLFGKQNSFISFPMEGYTLALDFPIKKGLFEFLDELDKIVLDFGGRIYLSKDARMKPEVFRKGYPNSQKFIEYIHHLNKDNPVMSDLSKRLLITTS